MTSWQRRESETRFNVFQSDTTLCLTLMIFIQHVTVCCQNVCFVSNLWLDHLLFEKGLVTLAKLHSTTFNLLQPICWSWSCGVIPLWHEGKVVTIKNCIIVGHMTQKSHDSPFLFQYIIILIYHWIWRRNNSNVCLF